MLGLKTAIKKEELTINAMPGKRIDHNPEHFSYLRALDIVIKNRNLQRVRNEIYGLVGWRESPRFSIFSLGPTERAFFRMLDRDMRTIVPKGKKLTISSAEKEWLLKKWEMFDQMRKHPAPPVTTTPRLKSSALPKRKKRRDRSSRKRGPLK